MGALVVLIGLLAVLILVPAVVLWLRLRGGEPVAGGSMGRQLFGGAKDDWGPKPTPPAASPGAKPPEA